MTQLLITIVSALAAGIGGYYLRGQPAWVEWAWAKVKPAGGVVGSVLDWVTKLSGSLRATKP